MPLYCTGALSHSVNIVSTQSEPVALHPYSTVAIWVSLMPGKEEEGGGLFAHFYVGWNFGSLELGRIDGQIEFTPLDVDGRVDRINSIFS